MVRRLKRLSRNGIGRILVFKSFTVDSDVRFRHCHHFRGCNYDELDD